MTPPENPPTISPVGYPVGTMFMTAEGLRVKLVEIDSTSEYSYIMETDTHRRVTYTYEGRTFYDPNVDPQSRLVEVSSDPRKQLDNSMFVVKYSGVYVVVDREALSKLAKNFKIESIHELGKEVEFSPETLQYKQ